MERRRIDSDSKNGASRGSQPQKPTAKPRQQTGKRQKAKDAGPKRIFCKVPGCEADLTELFAQGKRVRICHRHQRDLRVDMGKVGVQRYCQQCMRMHKLDLFDGDKRGCRRRLARHNIRRLRRATNARENANSAKEEQSKSGELSDLPRDQDSGDYVCPATNSDTSNDVSYGVGNGHAHDTEIGMQSFDYMAQAHPLQSLDYNSTGGNSTCDLAQGGHLALDAVFQQSVDSFQSSEYAVYSLRHRELQLMNEQALRSVNHASNSSLRRQMDALQPYSSGQTANIAFKFMGATPSCLPNNFSETLMSMTGDMSNDLLASIRPGCVQLSVDFMLDEFRSSDRLVRTFLESLQESLDAGGAMPWHSHDTNVYVGGQTIQIRGGRQISVPPIQPPVIEELRPVASIHDATQLLISGLNDEPFTVLFRINGVYYELEHFVEEPEVLGGPTHVSIELPMDCSGCGWVEVMQHSGSETVLSRPVAVLATPYDGAAKEISSVTALFPSLSQQQLNGVLQDLGAALHPLAPQFPVRACARALLMAARLRWVETVEEILDSATEHQMLRECLLAAESHGTGILIAAVQSRSLEILSSVVNAMQHAGITCDPFDLRGSPPMSPMHWAASLGLLDLVEYMLDQYPDCASLYPTCKAGPHLKTSQELLNEAIAGQGYGAFLGDGPSGASGEETAPVPGANLMHHLTSWPGRFFLTAVQLCVLYMLGSSASNAALATASCLIATQILAPYVFTNFYELPLHRVRLAAAYHGFHLTDRFEFSGQVEHEAFMRFSLATTCRWHDHVAFVMMVLGNSLRPMLKLYRFGRTCATPLLPILGLAYVLGGIRLWAAHSGRGSVYDAINIATAAVLALTSSSRRLWKSLFSDVVGIVDIWSAVLDSEMSMLKAALSLLCCWATFGLLQATLLATPMYRLPISRLLVFVISMATLNEHVGFFQARPGNPYPQLFAVWCVHAFLYASFVAIAVGVRVECVSMMNFMSSGEKSKQKHH